MALDKANDPRELIPAANRILVAHNVLDAYGHVSMRDDNDSDYFWISRNMAPGSVGPDDLQKFSIEATTSDPRRPYLEVFIHSEIYRSRPDVGSIVHSHAPAVLPYCIVDEPLACVSHMAGFLAQGVPNFEMREHAGSATDLLVTDQEAGRALADVLGASAVSLMRGHGAVMVGGSVPEAVHRAVFTVLNANVLTDALTIGGTVTTLTAEEGQAAMVSNQGQITRAWELWVAQDSQ